MPEFIVVFEVECTCGAGLCRQSYADSKHGFIVSVEPCEKCLNASYDKGFNDGQRED